MDKPDYGSPEWWDDVGNRHQDDLAAKQKQIVALSQKWGVLDADGKPTGKKLGEQERKALASEIEDLFLTAGAKPENAHS